MNSSRWIVLGIALGATILVALYVRNLTTQPATVAVDQSAVAEPVTQDAQVLTVAGDLKPGDRLAPEDLAWRAWPKAGITKNFITEENFPQALSEYTGAVARLPMFNGEPLIGGKVVKPGEAGFMAAILQPGLRAVSIQIAAETAASGFILPGDRVDVILTYEQETMEGTTTRSFHTSRTILENVRVLAVDQTSAADGDEQTIIGSTVTMELSVEEAEALALGEAIGEVTLALRSVADMAGALPGEYGRPRADKGFAQTVTNTVTVVRNGVATRVNSGGN